MTAEDYFTQKNGGKTPEECTNDGVLITPNFAKILMEDYHKESLKSELKEFNSWMCGKQYDGKIPLIGTCIKEYLEYKYR